MPAREIKTTLAVDGEQAYKRALNEAKTSVRNLGTQLSLAQAEFKKSGDAQKLMETRAKALKAEIDQQNEIVRSLDQALADAKKQYGEGSREAEKWQAELNRAKATMASLEAELNNNEKGLDRNGKAFDDASVKAGEFGDAVNNVSKGISFEMITSGIGKITSGFERAIKKATELAGQMWNMMRDAASWADDEITLAKIYGVDVEELQQMQHAAKIVDTDIDTIVKARQKLAKAMGSELKSDEIQKAFQTLRTPVYDDNGKMRDMENVFWEAGDALMNLDNEVDQNNIALQLFGKSWMELKPLFEAGRKAYGDAMAEATVVPKENIEKLGALQDQLDRLDTEFNALKMNVLSELAPAFEVLAKSLTDLMAEFNKYLETDEGKAMMESLSEAIREFFSELANVDMGRAVSVVSDGLEQVRKSFEWIRQHKDELVRGLEAIGIAFAGLKVIEIASNIGKVVWGFKQLMPGGGSSGTNTQTAANAAGEGTQAAAAATGGFWTQAKNMLTSGVSKAGSVALQYGNVMGVAGDMFLNQTSAGRALRDGTNVWDGLMQDLTEKAEEIKHNAETFGDDWRDLWENNPVIKFFRGLHNTNKEAEEWNLGDHVSAEEAEDFVKNGGEITLQPEKTVIEPDDNWVFGDDAGIEDIMNWMNKRDGGLVQTGPLDAGVDTGLYAPAGGGNVTGNRGLTSQDLADFQKVPGQMAAEVGKAVGGIKVQMDSTTVGRMVAPTVSNYIASQIA